MKSLPLLNAVARQVLGVEMPDHLLESVFGSLAKRGMTPRLPGPNEFATCSFAPKTAALCFDRVWEIFPGSFPEDIAFNGGTATELQVAGYARLLAAAAEGKEMDGWTQDEDSYVALLSRIAVGLHPFIYPNQPFDPSLTDFFARIMRAICTVLAEERQLNVTPLFDSSSGVNTAYQPGDRAALIATLSNISIVDEEKLTWEQVHEFRADSRSKSDLRRLMHWLDGTMAGKSRQFVEDEIGTRLDRYNRAMSKHGLQILVGSLKSVLDSRFVAAGGISAGAVNSIAGISAAAATAFALAVGRASVTVAQALLDLQDKREEAAGEIAFVIEASRLSK